MKGTKRFLTMALAVVPAVTQLPVAAHADTIKGTCLHFSLYGILAGESK